MSFRADQAVLDLESAARREAASPRVFDRHLWLVLALAAAVFVPRSLLISHAQSQTIDDEYHLIRGSTYWAQELRRHELNDPPLGAAITALPAVLTGGLPENRTGRVSWMLNHRLSPEALQMLIALWKAMLFVPVVGVVFHWCRRVYSARAAWLATVLLVVEPNFAAHIPMVPLDILGLSGVIIGCFLAWRYFEEPTAARLIAAAFAMSVALLLKHTAVILPGVVLIFAFLWWVVKPWIQRQDRIEWRARSLPRAGALAAAVGIVLLSMWALVLFDRSKPKQTERFAEAYPRLSQVLDRKVPGGVYIGSLLHGWDHARAGHRGYLWGEVRGHGWWYYFPAVGTYKVPIGAAVVLGLGLASLAVVRPRWQEWGLLVPGVAWTAFMMNSPINIGFRHFLPAYLFMIMLAGRCALGGRGWLIGASLGVAAAGVHALSYHPNYLSYVNFPRDQVHLSISDSNLDWGQGLKQVRRWIDANPQPGRTIYIGYFGPQRHPYFDYYLGDRAVRLAHGERPDGGVLIISPILEAGVIDSRDPFAALRLHQPVDLIGRSLLVYDLDALIEQGFEWAPLK